MPERILVHGGSWFSPDGLCNLRRVLPGFFVGVSDNLSCQAKHQIWTDSVLCFQTDLEAEVDKTFMAMCLSNSEYVHQVDVENDRECMTIWQWLTMRFVPDFCLNRRIREAWQAPVLGESVLHLSGVVYGSWTCNCWIPMGSGLYLQTHFQSLSSGLNFLTAGLLLAVMFHGAWDSSKDRKQQVLCQLKLCEWQLSKYLAAPPICMCWTSVQHLAARHARTQLFPFGWTQVVSQASQVASQLQPDLLVAWSWGGRFVWIPVNWAQ